MPLPDQKYNTPITVPRSDENNNTLETMKNLQLSFQKISKLTSDLAKELNEPDQEVDDIINEEIQNSQTHLIYGRDDKNRP